MGEEAEEVQVQPRISYTEGGGVVVEDEGEIRERETPDPGLGDDDDDNRKRDGRKRRLFRRYRVRRTPFRLPAGEEYKFKEAAADGGETGSEKTTVMIKNLPNKFTKEQLLELLDEHCRLENRNLQGGDSSISEYDFLYLPMDFRFLDKAAVATDKADIGTNRWRLCTMTQVEEFKSFIRVLPIWATTIALSISFAQLSTFFITQAIIMDRKLAPHFIVPPGSVPAFTAINGLLVLPFYEVLVVPLLRRRTGHRRGITSLQRIGFGLFVSVLALASAALVEKRRRHHAATDQRPMTFFWLLPQYFLMGTAEVFTYVGQLEFFYDEATDGTRSLSSALFLSEFGIGSWLSTALVKIVVKTTGGVERGWLQNNLNQSRLDYFYWILCGINVVNLCVYLMVSRLYRGREGVVRRNAQF